MTQSAPARSRSARFETAVTILIAVISTVIALIASQVALESGNAAEAQHNGVLASINLARVDGGTGVQIARNRRAFNAYRFNRDLYWLTFDFVTEAEDSGNTELGTRLRLEAAAQLEESNLAYTYIDSGYLTSDEEGNYVGFNASEFTNDRRQSASIYQDIDPEDNSAEATRARSASQRLSVTLLFWFVSLMFMTWAQITRSGLRWVWLMCGALVGLGLVALYVLTGILNLVG